MPVELPREGRGLSPNLLQAQHPPVFTALCKLKSIARAGDAQFSAWAERVLHDCRHKHSDAVKAALEDMALSWGDLSLPWRFYAKQLEAGERSGPPEAERLPPGTPVRHPVWGDDVIRFYRKTDGLIVLDRCGANVPPGEVTPCPN